MKSQLEEIFKGESKETIEWALAELGFEPKVEAGSIVLTADSAEAIAAAVGYSVEQLADPTGKCVQAIQAEIQAARDQAKKEVFAYVRAIYDLCALGGMEKMAPALIMEGATIDDARAKVQTELANKSRRTLIVSTIGGVGADGVNPLVEAAKKAAADYAARNMGEGTLPAARPGSDGGERLH